MHFVKGQLYHIYNQGNNRQDIFFNREHYLFFLKKMRTYVLPYCEIIAYCLMPNHFHLMVRVNSLLVPSSSDDSKSSDEFKTPRTFNQSIAIMLRSYTRAINKERGFSGSLFRPKTKAECLTCLEGITPSFYNSKFSTMIHIDNPEDQYPQICFNYIHQNPVRARLVANETDWEYSSATDYVGMRNGTLVNKEVAREYVKY